MYLFIDKGKYGHNTLYVNKSFRREDGTSTTKMVERLGRFEDLAKEHEDPIAWAKEYIGELNRLEQENQQKIILTYESGVLLEKNQEALYDGGYLFLKKLYYEYGFDRISRNISKKYNFEYDLNKILAVLIYGRILFPKSKLGTFEAAKTMLEKPNFELQHIYRALEVIAKEKDFIQSELYGASLRQGKRNDSVLYYDCTNYYFEIEHEDGIRKYGMSKEHRPNPIVEMGLFMDGDGIPLAFCIHDGNTNEQKTLKPLEEQIINDFGKKRFVVCTDAGLSSVTNKKFNNVSDRGFITAQSIKKMKAYQKEWALSPEGWHLPGCELKFNLNDILADEKLIEKYRLHVFYKEQWFNENDIEQRYIVTFSLKYMAYQRNIRNEQIERAKRALLSEIKSERTRQTDYKRLITKISVTTDGEVAEKKVYELNEDKISEEERYDGFYAVATNLEDTAEEIIRINRNRWEIEESFRIMKTEFKARPVYLSRDDRIIAHFTTCFLSLVLFRFLEHKLGHKYTCNEILSQLNAMKFLKTSEGFIPAYARTELTDDLHEAFGFRTDYQIITKSNMKNILKASKI